MDYFLENWGGFVGVLGLLASVGGLVYALLARRAAKSGEQAAREARNSVGRTLCLVSAQRALSLVVRLNILHREQKWDAALELYQELRRLLNDIVGMMPAKVVQFRAEINRDIGKLRTLEDWISEATARNSTAGDYNFPNESLNSIEESLEILVSSLMLPDESAGERSVVYEAGCGQIGRAHQ